MAKSYLKPLVALSSEAMFADARTLLIGNLSVEDLAKVAGEGVIGCTDRKVQERLIVAMLDILKDHADAEVAAVSNGDAGIPLRPTPSREVSGSPEIMRKRKVTEGNEMMDEPSQKAVKKEENDETSAEAVGLCEKDKTKAVTPQNPLATNEVSSRTSNTPQNQLEAHETSADSPINMIVVPTLGRISDRTASLRIGLWLPHSHRPGLGTWFVLSWTALSGGIGKALHSKFMELYLSESSYTSYRYFVS